MLGKLLTEIALTTIAVVLLTTALVAFLTVQSFRRLFGCGPYFDPWRST